MNMKSKHRLFALLACGLMTGTTALAQPIITNQPTWQTNIIGATATFSVGATGAPPLLYQWRKSAVGLPGQTNSTLVLTNLQVSQQAIYSVVVSNVGGSVTSSDARLYVLTLPTITPANPTASLFADLTLVGTNAPAGPVSYQWLLNGAPIAGAVTNRLVVANVQKTNAGAAYAIMVTYAFGSITSQVATLKITPFNSMYCFGFSWTDTGGNGCSWPAPRWYQNRACNGPMWPEFVSTNLGLAYAKSNNYAFCTAYPTSVLNQVRGFTAPARPELSLYCLMLAGTWDYSSEAAWEASLQQDVLVNSNSVHQLYSKGARTILIESQFTGGPGEITPDELTNFVFLAHSGTNDDVPIFNGRVLQAVNTYAQTRADLRIVWLDMYPKLGDVEANPSKYGFTTSTIDALSDTSFADKSFTGPGADYVFWDPLHPTSRVHQLIALWHLEALTNAVSERLEANLANSSATVAMNHLLIGRDYTLQTSSDLKRWNDVQTFTASAGTNQVSQALETGTRSTFYRLRWQQ